MDVYAFGELLTTFRKQHRMSQIELAEKLDVHRNTIGKWERGVYLPESKTIVLELATQLHLDDRETRQLLEASLTTISPYWNVPYQRNPFFTGRDSILQQLHDMLSQERSATISQSYALSGLGGIGKTQTAIEYAYRYTNEYAAVFWISAETNESIVSSFVAIAELLNLPEKQEKEQSRIIAAVTRWLTSHNNWLVIFDNVEDLELVKGVLPPARAGSLLFTSRRQALGFSAQTLDLEQMTPEEGTHFLLQRARLLDPTASLESLAPEDVALAREIVAVMDGLPLALDQAGAYIEATQCSLADYLRLFQSSQLRLLDERDAHADHPASVARTFALVFEQLERTNPAAAELLTVCAFLAPDAIPETFFTEGAAHLGPTFEKLAADPFAFRDAIKALRMYSLIQYNAATKMVTVHRLVQVVLKDTMSMAEQRQWAERVVRATSAVFPETVEMATWSHCRLIFSHAQACNRLIQDNSFVFEEAASLLFRVACYLQDAGFYDQAESMFLQTMRIWEQILKPGYANIVLAHVLIRLADIYLEQGKYEQTEQLFIRALGIRRQLLGSEHPLIAETLSSLATLYREQSKFDRAESLYLQALAMREQLLGFEHLHVAETLNNLAVLYWRQGKYEQAEPLFLRALEVREEHLGADHPHVAYILGNLSLLYRECEQYEKAVPLCQRAFTIYEQQLGIDHPYTAVGMNNLALLYNDQGKFEKAEPLLVRALVIREQRLEAYHYLIAQSLDHLATTYRERGKYEQAEQLYQRALTIYEQEAETHYYLLAKVLNNLAILYYEQGKYEQAELLFVRALGIREEYLGTDHPHTAETLHNLAMLREAQDNRQKAASLYQRAMVIREQALGLHHSKTVATRSAYTHLLREIGRIEEAVAVESHLQVPEILPL